MKAGVAGGIETAVKAINTHVYNAGVCYRGCGALWNMTVNGKALTKTHTHKIIITDENRVKAGAVGGIETVVNVIYTHINNADVCKHGCSTLLIMVIDNGKKKKSIDKTQQTK